MLKPRPAPRRPPNVNDTASPRSLTPSSRPHSWSAMPITRVSVSCVCKHDGVEQVRVVVVVADQRGLLPERGLRAPAQQRRRVIEREHARAELVGADGGDERRPRGHELRHVAHERGASLLERRASAVAVLQVPAPVRGPALLEEARQPRFPQRPEGDLVRASAQVGRPLGAPDLLQDQTAHLGVRDIPRDGVFSDGLPTHSSQSSNQGLSYCYRRRPARPAPRWIRPGRGCSEAGGCVRRRAPRSRPERAPACGRQPASAPGRSGPRSRRR